MEIQADQKDSGFRSFISRILTHRFFPLYAALLAVILTLLSLNAGLLVDDYHHKLLMTGSDSPIRILNSPIDMFNFFDGDPEHISEAMDYGFLPWWTYERIKGAFWRPLASITHWLDYIIWPNSPPLMHLHSIFWYGAFVMAVAVLYRRFKVVPLVAGLAALLYAIDDAHGTPVGFLANRNALMATLFGVLTIIAHDKWRRNNWLAGMVLSPLLLTASLLSAEAGISTCAYLAAYMFFIDRSSWRQRIVSMVPYAAVVIVWRLLWTHLGYGMENFGVYVDPLSEPLRFITAVKDRAPFLLLGQLALPPSDITMMLPPWYSIPLWRGALIFLVLLAFVFTPLLRRDRTARFWMFGMLLSILPICATFPSDRLLTFVGIGAMGLVAQLLFVVFGKTQYRPKLILWRIPATVLAVILIFAHLIIAPLALPVKAAYPMMPKKITEKLMLNCPLDNSIENQDLVVVNPPLAFLAMSSSLVWESENYPMPRHLRVLTSSLFRPVKIHCSDSNTIVVQPEYGYYAWVLDALFRDKKHPFSVGDRIKLTGMTVEILELTGDNRPAKAAFTFSVPLEDPSLRWLQYKDGSFVPFTPPAIGENMVLKSEKLPWN
ncbi:MAG: hypothetical protein PHQ35_00545 [Phycisphaerae bacterium]|nr:hypothetical protein [Phycisphaerae bacterium]MDD5381443.1 hypothetical protein [Phycisphaerae bacterium]